MQLVDLVLLVVLVTALFAGLGRGLLATLGGLLGLVVGGLAAFWAVPLVTDALPSSEWRGPAIVAVVLLLPLAVASLGARIGNGLRDEVDRTPLRAVERLLGGAASVVVTAIAASFVGATVVTTGMPGLATAMSQSAVLRFIEERTPPAVARPLAQARAFVLDDGLPRLDGLLAPATRPQLRAVDLDDPELEQAALSVARISGTAYACGTSSTGSGFVVAPNRLVTNAHVVAGVRRPVVELPGTAAVEGRVVYFDPVDDLAVVAVDGLAAEPLDLALPLDAGDGAAVQGYPYGGPFTSAAAGVLRVGTTRIPDVYDDGAAARDIYALSAQVHPGNSGGPVVTADGEVAGVVFARSESDPNLGYAMTTAELRPVADRAASLDAAVPPGRCAN